MISQQTTARSVSPERACLGDRTRRRLASWPRSRLAPWAVLALALASGCRGNSAAQGPPPAPPPSAVKIAELAPTSIEDASELIATLRSLRSTTVQPEVEGLITRIFVKAGQQVKAGTPLVQINAERQRAAVSSAEANLGGAESDVVYWQQQAKRLARWSTPARSARPNPIRPRISCGAPKRASRRSTRRCRKGACSWRSIASTRRSPAWSATSRYGLAIA